MQLPGLSTMFLIKPQHKLHRIMDSLVEYNSNSSVDSESESINSSMESTSEELMKNQTRYSIFTSKTDNNATYLKSSNKNGVNIIIDTECKDKAENLLIKKKVRKINRSIFNFENTNEIGNGPSLDSINQKSNRDCYKQELISESREDIPLQQNFVDSTVVDVPHQQNSTISVSEDRSYQQNTINSPIEHALLTPVSKISFSPHTSMLRDPSNNQYSPISVLCELKYQYKKHFAFSDTRLDKCLNYDLSITTSSSEVSSHNLQGISLQDANFEGFLGHLSTTKELQRQTDNNHIQISGQRTYHHVSTQTDINFYNNWETFTSQEASQKRHTTQMISCYTQATLFELPPLNFNSPIRSHAKKLVKTDSIPTLREYFNEKLSVQRQNDDKFVVTAEPRNFKITFDKESCQNLSQSSSILVDTPTFIAHSIEDISCPASQLSLNENEKSNFTSPGSLGQISLIIPMKLDLIYKDESQNSVYYPGNQQSKPLIMLVPIIHLRTKGNQKILARDNILENRFILNDITMYGSKLTFVKNKKVLDAPKLVPNIDVKGIYTQLLLEFGRCGVWKVSRIRTTQTPIASCCIFVQVPKDENKYRDISASSLETHLSQSQALKGVLINVQKILYQQQESSTLLGFIAKVENLEQEHLNTITTLLHKNAIIAIAEPSDIIIGDISSYPNTSSHFPGEEYCIYKKIASNKYCDFKVIVKKFYYYERNPSLIPKQDELNDHFEKSKDYLVLIFTYFLQRKMSRKTFTDLLTKLLKDQNVKVLDSIGQRSGKYSGNLFVEGNALLPTWNAFKPFKFTSLRDWDSKQECFSELMEQLAYYIFKSTIHFSAVERKLPQNFDFSDLKDEQNLGWHLFEKGLKKPVESSTSIDLLLQEISPSHECKANRITSGSSMKENCVQIENDSKGNTKNEGSVDIVMDGASTSGESGNELPNGVDTHEIQTEPFGLVEMEGKDGGFENVIQKVDSIEGDTNSKSDADSIMVDKEDNNKTLIQEKLQDDCKPIPIHREYDVLSEISLTSNIVNSASKQSPIQSTQDVENSITKQTRQSQQTESSYQTGRLPCEHSSKKILPHKRKRFEERWDYKYRHYPFHNSYGYETNNGYRRYNYDRYHYNRYFRPYY